MREFHSLEQRFWASGEQLDTQRQHSSSLERELASVQRCNRELSADLEVAKEERERWSVRCQRVERQHSAGIRTQDRLHSQVQRLQTSLSRSQDDQLHPTTGTEATLGVPSQTKLGFARGRGCSVSHTRHLSSEVSSSAIGLDAVLCLRTELELLREENVGLRRECTHWREAHHELSTRLSEMSSERKELEEELDQRTLDRLRGQVASLGEELGAQGSV
jgi:chromosome segregation ATPase